MPKRTRESSPIDQTIKLPKAFDGTYFEVVEYDKITKNITAKCVSCKLKDKSIRGKSTSTGNFYKHYQLTHPDDHAAMRTYCDERIDRKVVRVKRANQSVLPFVGALDQTKVNIIIYEIFKI